MTDTFHHDPQYASYA